MESSFREKQFVVRLVKKGFLTLTHISCCSNEAPVSVSDYPSTGLSEIRLDKYRRNYFLHFLGRE